VFGVVCGSGAVTRHAAIIRRTTTAKFEPLCLVWVGFSGSPSPRSVLDECNNILNI
jgi:hypothetical protein